MSRMIGRQVIGDGTLNVLVDGSSYTVAKDHPQYAVLRKAFNDKDADLFLKNLDVAKEVSKVVTNKIGTMERVKVDSSGVYVDGNPVSNSVSKAIMSMMANGFDFEPLVKFFERLLQNPSSRSVKELWGFLEVNGLMLTEDGCFLAYKSVRGNYLDKYSGTYDNKPGATMRMPRNEVDDDFTKHCSQGFHVGALAYSGPSGWYHSIGDKVIICKVAPEDVVSVPNDHNCQKLRTCAYTVVGDYKAPLNAPVYSGNVGDDYDEKDILVVDENNYVEELTTDDMVVNKSYSFTYVKEDGEEETRFGVLHDNEDCDIFTFYMSAKDKSAGNYRSFKTDYMYDIQPLTSVKF